MLTLVLAGAPTLRTEPPYASQLLDKAWERAGGALGWRFSPQHLATEAEVVAEAAKAEPHAWVAKAGAHGGVRVLPALPRGAAAAAALVRDGLVQRRVAAPMLVDGAAFDLGAYVVVHRAADGGVRYATYGDLLLRFGEGDFVAAAAAAAGLADEQRLRRGWLVGSGYRDAW